jgi:ATP-binding cassette subfamily B protein
MQEEKNKEKISGNVFDYRVLRRIFQFVKPYVWLFYSLIFLTLILAILAPARPYLIQQTVDNDIAVNDREGLLNMTLLLIGLALLQGVVQFLHTYLSAWLGQHVIRDIRVQLYQHILSLQLRFYDKTPIGRLVTRTVSDIETLADVFSNGLAAIAGDMLQLIFILAVMFYTDWRLTLISLSTLPILLISTYVFKEKIKVAFNDVRTAVSNLNTFVQEHITGMSVVQIFNSEERELQKFNKINQNHLQAHLKTVKYYSIYFPVAEVIAATGVGLVVWFGARQILYSDVTLGVLIAFIMYINQFFRPIRMIADRFNTLQMGIVSSSRILDLLDNNTHIPNNGNFAPERVEGKIEFSNVNFAYNDDDYVLRDISFSAEPGQMIALVGPTGAGKSSIINLLSRFYEIQQGEIFVDDKEIHEYQLDNLRKHIGVVLQDVFLFSDTIRNNITLNNTAISDDKIEEAARLVGAWEFINKLPGGLSYNVMERGGTLSVGQRQLISFVRTLVYDPRIIVLDEATSSVDSETEELIQQAVEKLMQSRTSLVIAHRLSTIQKADKILVLKKGRIVEHGTHSQLLQHDGLYADMHQIQYKQAI